MVQATEPTADTLEAQTNAATVEQTAQAAATGTDAAAGTGAEAASPTFDFDSEDGVRAALESLPTLRKLVEQRQNDGFNAGRQNRDKELRLERGTEDTARAWQEHLSEKYGVELDEADRRQAPLWVRANRDLERANYWRDTSAAVLDAFDVTERATIEAAFTQFDGLPDQMEQIGRQVVDEAVKRQTQKRVATMKYAEIPEGSALRKEIDELVASEAAKEIAAQQAEKPSVANPPRTPAGAQATGRTQADYARLTQQQIADLPEEEYRIAMGYGAA